MTAGGHAAGERFVTLIITEYVDSKPHPIIVQMANPFAVDIGRQILDAVDQIEKEEAAQ